MRLLSWKHVREKVVYSRQHWDRLIAAGRAPRPVRLGEHRVAWLETEIDAWIEERISRRNQQSSE